MYTVYRCRETPGTTPDQKWVLDISRMTGTGPNIAGLLNEFFGGGPASQGALGFIGDDIRFLVESLQWSETDGLLFRGRTNKEQFRFPIGKQLEPMSLYTIDDHTGTIVQIFFCHATENGTRMALYFVRGKGDLKQISEERYKRARSLIQNAQEQGHLR